MRAAKVKVWAMRDGRPVVVEELELDQLAARNFAVDRSRAGNPVSVEWEIGNHSLFIKGGAVRKAR